MQLQQDSETERDAETKREVEVNEPKSEVIINSVTQRVVSLERSEDCDI